MRYSKYNILSEIRDSEHFFIVNLLTGNADIIDASDIDKILTVKGGGPISDKDFENELQEKGYLIDENREKQLYRNKYLDFIDSRDKDEIQIFFVPNYSCNFSCSYCYQDHYTNPSGILNTEIIDAFFRYIKHEFAGRQKYITLFGGEPLLPSARQKEVIRYFLDSANNEDLDVCIVTNGYTLSEYVELLRSGRIREIQVTLDGTEPVHNSRRFIKGGAGTFNKIVQGIDACIQNNITVNLRAVIDKENIAELPDLAQFAIYKGWTQSPYFKTQIGRNYELHHCQSAPEKLFTRISLYEALYTLIKQHPHVLDFYKPAYSIAKFLAENQSLPDPLFDSCPACKTEWAFDYTGNIYSCTATVGKNDESLGTFFPRVEKHEPLAEEWESRDITSIAECRDCSVQLACGGGCGSVAKNKSGKICSPDCRPVKELLELGFAQYNLSQVSSIK